MTELTINTKNKREVVDITDEVSRKLQELGAKDGVLNLFLTHTTAALTTADLDPGGTDEDYLETFEKFYSQLPGG